MKKSNCLLYFGSGVIIAELMVLAGIHVIHSHAEVVLADAPVAIEETAPMIIIHPEVETTPAVTEIHEAPPIEETTAAPRQENYLGSFKLTAYCGCTKCCGKNAKKGADGEWLAITRSGVRAQPQHTIAVDPKVIPLGSQVRIGDIIYTAEDTGGKWVQGSHIDIFMRNHSDAAAFGCQRADVYLVK